ATANPIPAIQNGARQGECTINGIVECAGNTSVDEVAMSLNVHHKCFNGLSTNINSKLATHISRQVSTMMNMPAQPNESIVGRNAFAHSSGIHQDGFLKHRENYEIIKPEDVGLEEADIILTARSGRHALKFHLERLGFSFDKERLNDVYKRFLDLAD